MNKNKTNVSIVDNSGIRRKASIVIGGSGSHASGIILDANAVEELVGQKLGNKNVSDFNNDSGYLTSSDIEQLQNSVQNIQSLIDADEQDIDTAIDKFEEIVDFLSGIEPGSELYNIILSHIDGGNSKVVKHIEVLTQEQYNALDTNDANTDYNIIENV